MTGPAIQIIKDERLILALTKRVSIGQAKSLVANLGLYDLSYGEVKIEFVKHFRELIRVRNLLFSYWEFTREDLTSGSLAFEKFKSECLEIAQKANEASVSWRLSGGESPRSVATSTTNRSLRYRAVSIGSRRLSPRQTRAHRVQKSHAPFQDADFTTTRAWSERPALCDVGVRGISKHDPQARQTRPCADFWALPSDRSPAPSSVNFRQSNVSRVLARRVTAPMSRDRFILILRKQCRACDS